LTIEEIIESTEYMLTPEDISDILGSNPATIRETARQNPIAYRQLGPVWTGNRLKFPRLRFIGWFFGEYKMEDCNNIKLKTNK